MDRTHDDSPATRFALQILRHHPQIRYEHAVSAAEYAGIDRLPAAVFFGAADRLGIPRDDRIEDAGAPVSPASPESPASREPLAALASELVASLDALRAEVGQTRKVHTALLAMRQVIRAALAEDGRGTMHGQAGD